MKSTSPLKWHGGKAYLAKRIIQEMPPRALTPNYPKEDDKGWLHYVEPYAGGLQVLFAQNPEGISEVVNDINGDLTNFWKVMAYWRWFEDFKRIVEATPMSQQEWNIATEKLKHPASTPYPVHRAVRFFIKYRQSRQGLGKDFATLTRNRTRRGMNEQVSAWLSSIEGLAEANQRLRRVLILNDHAIKVVRDQDGPRTLFYLDPTYLQETRVSLGDYEFEMEEEDHVDLLWTLGRIKGRFILSGYPSDLYDRFAKRFGWRHVDIEIDNKASGKKTKDKKIERLWMNYYGVVGC